MTNLWGGVSIGDLCASGEVELQTGPFGAQLHSYDYLPDGVPVVPTEAIGGGRLDHSVLPKISNEKAATLERHRLKENDILFARRGVQATGKAAIVRAHEAGFICGTGAIRLRIKDTSKTLDPKFLASLLTDQASIDWFKFHAIGATMPNLNEGIIKAFSFSLPPLPEQRAIAATLGALDDKIELNRRMNETLEAMARALFRDWFVDFGPTRAKMAGTAPYLSPDIWSLFPDRLDDEGKPEGWEEIALKQIGNVVTGKTPSTKRAEYFGAEMPFLKIPDMHGKMYAISTSTALSREGSKSQQNKTLPAGSVSVSCIATPGLVVLNHRETHTNQQINSVVPSALEQSLFVFWSCRQLAADVMLGGSGGSVFHNMNKTSFENLQLVFPGNALARFFSDAVEPLHERILANEHGSQTLAQTRDLLLPRLMSGDLRVAQAERIAAEVL